MFSYYILEDFHQIYSLHIFSPGVWLVFWKPEVVLIFIKSSLVISFMDCAFNVFLLKKSCPSLCLKGFLFVFFQKYYIFRFTLALWFILSLHLIWDMGPKFFFCTWISNCSSLLKRQPFLHWIVFAPLWHQLSIFSGCFSGLCCSVDLSICLSVCQEHIVLNTIALY